METLSESGVHHKDDSNGSEVTANTTASLEDFCWTPWILHLLALIHFVLSAVLIASYWHLMVSLGSIHRHIHIHIPRVH